MRTLLRELVLPAHCDLFSCSGAEAPSGWRSLPAPGERLQLSASGTVRPLLSAFDSSTPGRTRTCNLRIRSPLPKSHNLYLEVDLEKRLRTRATSFATPAVPHLAALDRSAQAKTGKISIASAPQCIPSQEQNPGFLAQQRFLDARCIECPWHQHGSCPAAAARCGRVFFYPLKSCQATRFVPGRIGKARKVVPRFALSRPGRASRKENPQPETTKESNHGPCFTDLVACQPEGPDALGRKCFLFLLTRRFNHERTSS